MVNYNNIKVQKNIDSTMQKMRERSILRNLDRNTSYVRSNYRKLQKTYPNQYVVIGSGKLLAHEKSVAALDSFIKKMSIEKNKVLIKRIPRYGVNMFY